ncbi:MAG: DNA alkylation repair protein [Acutalibacteraceae bacterium]
MFTEKDYNNLLTQLEGLADKKFGEFHSKLVPDVNNVLGISVPKLRKVAKELIDSCNNIEEYFALVGNKYYEETMLQGIIIGYLKCSWDKKLEYIKDFIPKIKDWAVCDIFCGGIKPPKNEFDSFRNFTKKYLCSSQEFQVRFGVVILLQKYINDDYISSTLLSLENTKHNGYYVQMAVAWALSICYIKYPQQTMKVFEKRTLSRFVQNKSIQKCRESLRVTAEDKEMLLKYKIK